MEVTAEVRTDGVPLLTPPRPGDESAALGSQASVGFLSYGGPVPVSCSTFETPTKTSPVTRRRWSPARSLSQVSQAASRASCRSRSRSPRSSSFPLGQPDPPTPEAIEATQNSQVIIVDDDPSQSGPGPMNLVDMGLSQALWLPEDIKTQDKIWLWSQSVPPTADSISCTQLPRRYHIVSQTPPKVQRSEAVVVASAAEASVLAQHQALQYASPEESFGAAQGRDAESHMDLNLATPLVQQRAPETEDCESLEEEMPFSLDLGWSQPSQDLAIQSPVSVHEAKAMPLQSQVDDGIASAKDNEATKACSQANAGSQNAGSQPAPETNQHPTSTPHGSSPEQVAAAPMPPLCQSAAIFELAKDAEVAARPAAARTVDVSECFGQPATASPNMVQAKAMPLQSQVDDGIASAKDNEATTACSRAHAGSQNAGSQPAPETFQHPTSTPHGSSPEQVAADKSEDAEWWKANTCETDGEHGELWRLLEQMHASAHSGVGDAANASAVGQAGAAETDADFPMETSTKDPSQPTHQDLNLKLQEEMQHAADASAVGQAGAAEIDAVEFAGQEHAGPLIHEKEPLEADWQCVAEDPDVSENETSQKSWLPAAQPSPVTEDSRLGEASQGASDLQQVEDPLEFWRSLFGDVLRPRRAATVAVA